MEQFANGVRVCTGEQAMFIELEPGDQTKYRFLISDVVHPIPERAFVRIASVDGPRFDGYLYHKEDIRNYAFRHAGQTKDYSLGKREKMLDDDYLSYVMAHSRCDRCTAVAAMMAGDYVLNIWKKSNAELLEV